MKMKFISLVSLILISLLSLEISGQNRSGIEELKAPGMPSASIIGSQASEVNSPKSLKALEVAILSNYLDSEQQFTIPNDYALEINPFMLSGRKNFDYNEYLANDFKSNIWHNFSISVSSTQNFLIGDSVKSNAMGFGARSILLNGKVNRELSEGFEIALKKVKDNLDISSKVPTLISYYLSSKKDSTLKKIQLFVLQELEKDEDYNQPQHSSLSDAEYFENLSKVKLLVSSVFDKIPLKTKAEEIASEFVRIYKMHISEKAFEELKATLKEIKHNRYGLRMEVDFAYALSFPSNDFDYSISPRWGMWTNISWRPKITKDGMNKMKDTPTNIEFIGLARYMKNNSGFIDKFNPVDTSFYFGDYLDFGTKVAYSHDRFSVDFEFIYRFNSKKESKVVDGFEYNRKINNDTRKYVLNFNYNISSNIVLTYYLGKGFEDHINSGGNLRTGLNINLGFGNILPDELISKSL